MRGVIVISTTANFNLGDAYSFAPHWHDIGGMRMHYVDEGSGDPVVMVHGNPTWSFFYRDVVKALSPRFRCLVPDHIGCGMSDKPQEYSYTLATHIGNLESWLESVLPPAGVPGGKINLLVHDWGGPIGLGYAVRHPERIKSVAVMNSAGFVAGGMPWRILVCRWPMVGELLVRGLNGFALGAAYMTTMKPLPPDIRRGFVAPYSSWANRVAVHQFVMDIPLYPFIPSYPVLSEIGDKLPAVLAGKPLLIQWGMRDWCFTAFFLNEWRKRFPDARVDEYEAGHYLLEDAGDRIIPRLEQFFAAGVAT